MYFVLYVISLKVVSDKNEGGWYQSIGIGLGTAALGILFLWIKLSSSNLHISVSVEST